MINRIGKKGREDMWIFTLTFGWILYILLNVLLYSRYYFSSQLSLGGFAQVLYTMQNSMSGSEGTWSEAVTGFFVRQWPALLIGTVVYGILLWVYIRRKKNKLTEISLNGKEVPLQMKWIKTSILAVLVGMVTLNAVEGYQLYGMFGIDEYLKNQNATSDLYERFYADPRAVSVEFPDQKKNLIYILCESMESTFAGEEEGGGFEKSLIPELTSLAKEHTDFSDDPATLNGGLTPGNTGWTIAGIVAQSMGIPLNIGNGDFNRNFEDEAQFLPHVIGLGDILSRNGYSNYFMCGSESEFAGRKNYYEQHGNYKVYDYNTAKEDGIIPEDYRVWWGFEDDKLFSYARQELSQISKNEEPFNFTMLTVDTHFIDGYKCPDCPDEYDTQYENVIRCSDHKVTEFVEWIQKQDFYDNTTIVIAGDHKSMDGMVEEHIPENYERKTFFTVINGPEYTLDKTREYATLDIYPTIVESLDAEIKGHRLGLGTSLYSSVPTLVEELGFDELNSQMSQKSEFYDSVIMNGDESKLPEQDEPEEGTSDEEDSYETKEAVTITAQQYEEHQENFTDPGYVWTPPVQEPVYDPGYTAPEYTAPAPSAPVTPPDSGTVPPTSGGEETVTPPATGGEGGSGGSDVTPPAGGDSTGGSDGSTTPPSTGGDGGSTGGNSGQTEGTGGESGQNSAETVSEE